MSCNILNHNLSSFISIILAGPNFGPSAVRVSASQRSGILSYKRDLPPYNQALSPYNRALPGSLLLSYGSETLHIRSEGCGEMFEVEFADTSAENFRLCRWGNE